MPVEHRPIVWGAFLIALTGACGTLTTPISFSGDESERSAEAQSREESAYTITPVEGRPRGLLLEITARADLAKNGELEVLRRIDDDPTETIRTIELGTSRLEQLANGGLQFLDRSVVPDKTHHYRVVYIPPNRRDAPTRDELSGSPTVSVHWESPPSRPKRLDAQQTGQVVELTWSPTKYGAVIFRRNVLDERAETRRIATVGPGATGRFVDRTVQPGRVYAYQIAIARKNGEFPRFGHPSDSLYVSLE